ncbi:Hemerythrin HHE cation binding domain protein [Gloeothece citriformis PCC 7424]|uniref:Hemerythrin HHE cation binding domain protein n=1 Tax=Gloeothece citriformis (strain PCC 7424) TaxID=65393 RepID=B7KAC3_GLOC7|nr:hemerythrin domain-containing protein [Gloeothece citriformis]ACK72897.1 Hemerythrin HHE cation binding domain protein [Gloeothece citriformis PCC 7424]
MVATIPDQKRQAIAQKLASMRAIQNLIIDNERQFIQECSDQDIKNRLQQMLEDDQKNIGVIETSITQYGIQAEPKETVKKMVEQAQQMMKGSQLSMYEKMVQHELLKHGQVMSGLIVHKAGQIAGADVEAALGPLNTVNFENRAHQEQLKGILEVLGTMELTGQKADQSVWGRVQDALSAITGAVGSAVTQTSDKSDMNIQDIIRMDHQKARTLFAEIEGTNDTQKIREYFSQLYNDLMVHSEAEEQTVYPTMRPYYGEQHTQELFDEQAQLKSVLEELKSLSPTSSEFKSKLQEAKNMVNHHANEEENSLFAAIRNNCSSDQQEQMATRFKEAKKQLQTKMQKS